jgi:hypothetical protein
VCPRRVGNAASDYSPPGGCLDFPAHLIADLTPYWSI